MGSQYAARGAFPVAVTTFDVAAGDRTLPVELWYPALPSERGRDLDVATQDHYRLMPALNPHPQHAVRDGAAAPGAYPLVVFSHGFGGHRRQSTFVCTHLASHGYVVLAADHIGNTAIDLIAALSRPNGGETIEVERLAHNRIVDVRAVLDHALASHCLPAGVELIDGQVGLCGHSFGGWTSLAVTGIDRRVTAVAAMAPAGGDDNPVANMLRETMNLDWQREVPLLVVAADRDSLVSLGGVQRLTAELAEPKALHILENTDHMHFCDFAALAHAFMRTPLVSHILPVANTILPFRRLTPAEQAEARVRGLLLEHFEIAFRSARALACG